MRRSCARSSKKWKRHVRVCASKGPSMSWRAALRTAGARSWPNRVHARGRFREDLSCDWATMCSCVPPDWPLSRWRLGKKTGYPCLNWDGSCAGHTGVRGVRPNSPTRWTPWSPCVRCGPMRRAPARGRQAGCGARLCRPRAAGRAGCHILGDFRHAERGWRGRWRGASRNDRENACSESVLHAAYGTRLRAFACPDAGIAENVAGGADMAPAAARTAAHCALKGLTWMATTWSMNSRAHSERSKPSSMQR